MDADRFDAITRALATTATRRATRRAVAKALAGAALGALLGARAPAAAADDDGGGAACAAASDCAGDGDPCTAVACIDGQCVHYPVVCNPGFVCADAECVPDGSMPCPSGLI